MSDPKAAHPAPSPDTLVNRPLRPLPRLIFMSRWLQLPLYLGLILAQCVYVFHFWAELTHLIEAAVGSEKALNAVFSAVGMAPEMVSGAATSGAETQKSNPTIANSLELTIWLILPCETPFKVKIAQNLGQDFDSLDKLCLSVFHVVELTRFRKFFRE